ncbi:glycosyltransferase [Salinisphaera sp.]|uniref:glycosyltransferase n=1 Tax=Salinisphaera sp. TaxID=1914330 RepID=UPI002D771B61|nr:glycosyltransferase [Salinisphaera sp.]HET7315579.1 glycosyltransferase [Salinisphaera sp.]
MTGPSLMHYVSLDAAGGVELQFADFISVAVRRGLEPAGVVACGRRIHPLVAARFPKATPIRFEKYAGPIKWPKWPPAIRRAWQARLLRRADADGVVIWNRLRDSVNTLRAAGPARCVYWERGASWFADVTPAKTWFIEHIQAVLANSFAARRMLELRWGYRGQIRVVPNALRPALAGAADAPRAAPTERWRLGMVARLVPIKGTAIALHALARLRKRGFPVTLAVAGDGPERATLARLAERLGIADAVIFHGLVSDMGSFYRAIDVLVHPALREPFGQIAIEANAYGVPAIVSAVDGLVEVVADDVSGLCLAPEEDLSVYAELGGGDDDLPPYVYHPGQDAIGAPRVLAPNRLADAVAGLIEDHARYERLSRDGWARVRTRFDFGEHVDAAIGAIRGYLKTGTLVSP